jgi:hypothetical protein
MTLPKSIPPDVPKEWVSAQLVVAEQRSPNMDISDDDSVGKPNTTQTKGAKDDFDTIKDHRINDDGSSRAKTGAFVTRLAEPRNPKKDMYDSDVTPSTAQTRRTANNSETTKAPKDTTKAKTRALSGITQHTKNSPKESSPLMVQKQPETNVCALMQRGLAKRMHWVVSIAVGGLLTGMK